LAGRFDGLAEVGAADHILGEDVDGAIEEGFQGVGEVEIALAIVRGVRVGEYGHEVEVAGGGVEGAGGGRAEEVEAAHAVAAAERGDFGEARGDDVDHGPWALACAAPMMDGAARLRCILRDVARITSVMVRWVGAAMRGHDAASD
jgi:hypothetical protein